MKLIQWSVVCLSVCAVLVRGGEPQVAPLLPAGATATFTIEKSDARNPILSPDGRLLVSGVGDMSIHELSTGKTLHQFFGGEVYCFSPDGNQLYYGSAWHGQQLSVWSIPEGKMTRTFHTGESHVRLAASPDGKLVASYGLDLTVNVWKAENLALAKSIKIKPVGGNGADGLAFTPDSRRLMASVGGSFFFFDCDTWKFEIEAKLPRAGKFDLTRDGSTLAVQTEGSLVIWDMAQRKARATCKIGENVNVFLSTVSFSHDELIVATAQEEGIRFWDPASGQQIFEVKPPGKCSSITFCHDGKTFLMGVDKRQFYVYDIAKLVLGDKANKVLAPAEFTPLWTQLGGKEAARAWIAALTLQCGGDAAVTFFKSKFRLAERNEVRIKALVENLDKNGDGVRGTASAELKKLGYLVEADLRKALEGTPTERLKNEIAPILKLLESRPPTDALPQDVQQRIRAIQVVERIGTKPARELLSVLSVSAPTPQECWEAKQSLARMGKE